MNKLRSDKVIPVRHAADLQRCAEEGDDKAGQAGAEAAERIHQSRGAGAGAGGEQLGLVGVVDDRQRGTARLISTPSPISMPTLGGSSRFDNQARVTLGYAALTADAGLAPTSNLVTGPIANYSGTFGVSANGEIRIAVAAGGVEFPVASQGTLNASVYSTRVSGNGIASNRYNTYALLAKYLLSKRTFVYAALDHETAAVNGGLVTVSGGRGNTGITAGIQTRF